MKKKKNYNVDDSDYLANSGAATEVTGLMYQPAKSQYELESYEEIRNFRPQDIDTTEEKDERMT